MAHNLPETLPFHYQSQLMPHIQKQILPAAALLGIYARAGAYTDCYATAVPASISLADYVEAFYTSRLFKVERFLLSLLMNTPADDGAAGKLARGEAEYFSAWVVEGRGPDQILLRDVVGRTRSWLMVMPEAGPSPCTRLCFGSAVIPKSVAPDGGPDFGFAFHVLSGFHRWYSRALLRSAFAALQRRGVV